MPYSTNTPLMARCIMGCGAVLHSPDSVSRPALAKPMSLAAMSVYGHGWAAGKAAGRYFG